MNARPDNNEAIPIASLKPPIFSPIGAKVSHAGRNDVSEHERHAWRAQVPDQEQNSSVATKGERNPEVTLQRAHIEAVTRLKRFSR